MEDRDSLTAHFSGICVERCGGLCCDPWWGIVSYQVVKDSGPGGLAAFTEELARGIEQRAGRITGAYVTREETPRPLFSAPERYNVRLTGVRADGGRLTLNLLAMFAFRCAFLSQDRSCGIHPAFTGGVDIRPPHCGEMGSLEASPGGKGYCRIIHAAEGSSGASVESAIEIEKASSRSSYEGGVRSAHEAAESVVAELKKRLPSQPVGAAPQRATARAGRNDPCPCGSGKKFKKCHGNA